MAPALGFTGKTIRHWITSFRLLDREVKARLHRHPAKDTISLTIIPNPDDRPLDSRERAWTGLGRVRARELSGGGLEIAVEGLTTQAKYYKPLIHEFFRKEWRRARPAWGDYTVEIRMEYQGDPPWLDLDNLAKALLDAIKGYAFHDDAQVGRLVVERFAGERERIYVRVTERAG